MAEPSLNSVVLLDLLDYRIYSQTYKSISFTILRHTGTLLRSRTDVHIQECGSLLILSSRFSCPSTTSQLSMSGDEGTSSKGTGTVSHTPGSKLSADDIKSIAAEVASVLRASSEPGVKEKGMSFTGSVYTYYTKKKKKNPASHFVLSHISGTISSQHAYTCSWCQ